MERKYKAAWTRTCDVEPMAHGQKQTNRERKPTCARRCVRECGLVPTTKLLAVPFVCKGSVKLLSYPEGMRRTPNAHSVGAAKPSCGGGCGGTGSGPTAKHRYTSG